MVASNRLSISNADPLCMLHVLLLPANSCSELCYDQNIPSGTMSHLL